MDPQAKAQILQEIELLEVRLAEAKLAKPAHDTAGAHKATLLEIEDELSDKRQALCTLDESSNSPAAERKT